MKRALVLGGGGPVGIAWHHGLVIGLREEGIELRDADIIVGTSAGSLVGTRLADGQDLAQPAPGGQRLGLPLAEGGMDTEKVVEIFKLWNEALEVEQMDAARRQAIGRLACEARTCSPEVWIAATGGSTGVADWPLAPSCDLRIVGIDVARGERVLFDRESGVPLHKAIAASCCVPGMFPPVEIDGTYYIDGGVGTGTSAEYADRGGEERTPEVVLAIAPMCTRTIAVGTCAEAALEFEAADLRARGADVCVVFPDEKDVEAFGPSLMDPSRTGAVTERGIERGRELARGEAAIWNG